MRYHNKNHGLHIAVTLAVSHPRGSGYDQRGSMTDAQPIQPPKQIIYRDQYEVDARLAELGLHSDKLATAIAQGEYQRREAVPYDPPVTGGFNAWARATRVLGELYVPLGWKREDLGQPKIINGSRTIAVVASTGDRHTGNPNAHPRSKYPKGEATKLAVRQNGQGQFFGRLPDEPEPEPSNRQTWLLLMYSSVNGVQAELSLPNAMDSSNYVSDFAERVILPTVGSDGTRPIFGSEEEDLEPVMVEVMVQRRSS